MVVKSINTCILFKYHMFKIDVNYAFDSNESAIIYILSK